MKWIEAKVIFESENQALAEELISDIFYNFNLQGVVIEQPDLDPDEGWGSDALEKSEHYSVSGYIPDNEFAEGRQKKLENELSKLEKTLNVSCSLSYNSVDEEDWEHSWKEYFWPEKISGRFVVKPTWRDYEPQKGDLVIEIDPGMAFGTGTHPTTSLCVNMLEKYLHPGNSLLDIGTGSGILMIAAEKLGAVNIAGIDIDEVAVEIAEKNMVLNGIDPGAFHVKCGNLAKDVDDRYNIVVANILPDVIIELLSTVKNVLTDDGIFICSGIIEDSCSKVMDTLKLKGFEVVEHVLKESWVVIVAKIKGN